MNLRVKKAPRYLLWLFSFPLLGLAFLQIAMKLPPREKMRIPVKDELKSVKTSDYLKPLGLEIISYIEDENSFEATLSGNLRIFLTKKQDLSRQVASLQYILNRSKIEGKRPSKIDLRFDKPVIKY